MLIISCGGSVPWFLNAVVTAVVHHLLPSELVAWSTMPFGWHKFCLRLIGVTPHWYSILDPGRPASCIQHMGFTHVRFILFMCLDCWSCPGVHVQTILLWFRCDCLNVEFLWYILVMSYIRFSLYIRNTPQWIEIEHPKHCFIEGRESGSND